MTNPFTSYYVQQSGSGIAGYQGTRLQRGFGFWGRLFSSTILPAIKWAGKRVLSTGTDVLDDVLDGRNVQESIKDRGTATLKSMGRTATKRARAYVNDEQTGSGKRRKRRKVAPKKKVNLIKKKGYKRRRKRIATKFPDFLK